MNLITTKIALGMALIGTLGACTSMPQKPPLTYTSGCGTLTSLEDVNEAPQFVNPLESKTSNADAGNIGQLLSNVPGLGLAANAAISVGSAMAIDAAANSASKTGNVGSPNQPVWKGVKRLTIKPDFGDQFTITLLGLSSVIKQGNVVVMGVDRSGAPDRFYVYRLNPFVETPDLAKNGVNEAYLKQCYQSNQWGAKQVVYEAGKFVEKPLPAPVQAYIDSHPAKP